MNGTPSMTSVRNACLGLAFALGSLGVHANSTQGAWESWSQLPYFPVHSSMLPTGKVLLWPGDAGISGNDPRLLDPVTKQITFGAKPNYDVFCSGHAFQADGQLLVAGGHIMNSVGLARASRYDPASNSWIGVPDMNAGRWYPTVTTLANGDALVVSGDIDTTVGVNKLPQVYQRGSNSWRSLSTAQLAQPLYPMMILMPDGRVMEAGPSISTRALDTSGTGQWTTIASRMQQWRDYGTAVVTDGKVLIAGGGDPPSSSAEVIDLNQPSPAWRTVQSMSIARRHLNATILPDGKVLITGGTSGRGFNDTNSPVLHAEMWDPATETWTRMASGTVPRVYHAAATLLPDGRVLVTGGNGQLTAEMYSPPYLYKGERPVITAAPEAVPYGSRFTVQTPQASGIAKVTMIRMPSVTHGFDENQRLNTLAFTPGTDAIEVTSPANGNLAPPGHYMLFLVNSAGVPSLASIVRIGSDVPPPPPPAGGAATLSALSPSTAPAGSPDTTLSVAGSAFAPEAAVHWNGSARPTTFASPTQLSARIAAADLAQAGTASVTVVNPNAPPSNALPFTITAPTGGGTTTYRLAVTKTGSEAARATVSSSPAGISCGSQCTASFASGTRVTLSARAPGNVRFTGWTGGGCSGTGTCVVTMGADTTVTANFVRR